MVVSKLSAFTALLVLCLFALSVNGQTTQAPCKFSDCPYCAAPLIRTCGVNPLAPEDGVQCACGESCGKTGVDCPATTQLACGAANLTTKCGDGPPLRPSENRCSCQKCSSSIPCKASFCDGNSQVFCDNGACGCRPKPCTGRSQCTGACPTGTKRWCKDSICQCVPSNYCESTSDCPTCTGGSPKKYCPKYAVPSYGLVPNQCNCIGADSCQQNSDCGTLECCRVDPASGGGNCNLRYGTCTGSSLGINCIGKGSEIDNAAACSVSTG